MVYGMALLMTIAKRQHDEDTAIAIGTERLELLVLLKDHAGQMEAIADLAHCQATIGEFNTAQDLFQQSLERATELGAFLANSLPDGDWLIWRKFNKITKPPCWFLSDSLHEFIAADVPAPAQLRQRIKDLTELKDQPSDNAS